MPSPVTIVRSAPEDLFDVRVRQDEGSRFVGTMPWSGPVTSPSGDPALGALGVLVDEVLGYSLIASLSPGQRGRQVRAGPPAGPAPSPVAVPSGGLAGTLGVRRTAGDHLVLEPSSTLANPLGVVHGGISFAASELAASLDREKQGSALRTSSVHIAHLRAAPVDEPFELRVETVHRGRGLWVSDVRGVVAGRLCTSARVTAE